MFTWNWLNEINLTTTASILSEESNDCFSEDDYKKHLPQKVLKPFFIDLIENHDIDVFILPILSKLQIAAGEVLSLLKKRYPYIRFIILKFSDFDVQFCGEYLHICWRLGKMAYIYTNASTDHEVSPDLTRKDVITYLSSLHTVFITGNLEVKEVHRCSFAKNEKSDNEVTASIFQSDDRYPQQRIIKLKRKVAAITKKVSELNKQLDTSNVLLDAYTAELKRLEKKIERDKMSGLGTNGFRDIHTGLYGKYVLWPVGYCHNHNCVLDEMDIVKRKCVLRKGRAGIYFHFRSIDENGVTIDFTKKLFAHKK